MDTPQLQTRSLWVFTGVLGALRSVIMVFRGSVKCLYTNSIRNGVMSLLCALYTYTEAPLGYSKMAEFQDGYSNYLDAIPAQGTARDAARARAARTRKRSRLPRTLHWHRPPPRPSASTQLRPAALQFCCASGRFTPPSRFTSSAPQLQASGAGLSRPMLV